MSNTAAELPTKGGRQRIMTPKDVHALIPEPVCMLHDKTDLANVIKVKDLEILDYPGRHNLITNP